MLASTVATVHGSPGRARYKVRRGKARFLRGCKSLPARVVPAGSNRSSREGNDPALLQGKLASLGKRATHAPSGSTGVVTTARTQRESEQHGRPRRAVGRETNRRPVKVRPGAAGSRMGS